MTSFRIHPAGVPFVVAFIGAAALLWWLTPWLGLPAAVIALWCVWFFRDPDRVTPGEASVVYSAADGKVVGIGAAVPPPELGLGDKPMPRVSVFLNIFDVHVNRAPIAGTIADVRYHPGQFINASFDKASDLNERQAVRMTDGAGRDVVFVQIAGLIARRIICTLRPGQSVRAGERYGLIRFGSRTDVYLPDGSTILVTVGEHVVGGESEIARLPSVPNPREVSGGTAGIDSPQRGLTGDAP